MSQRGTLVLAEVVGSRKGNDADYIIVEKSELNKAELRKATTGSVVNHSKHGRLQVLHFGDDEDELWDWLDNRGQGKVKHEEPQSRPGTSRGGKRKPRTTQDVEFSDDEDSSARRAAAGYLPQETDDERLMVEPAFLSPWGSYTNFRFKHCLLFDFMFYGLPILGYILFQTHFGSGKSLPKTPEDMGRRLVQLERRLSSLEENSFVSDYDLTKFKRDLEYQMKSEISGIRSQEIGPLSKTLDNLEKEHQSLIVKVDGSVSELSVIKKDLQDQMNSEISGLRNLEIGPLSETLNTQEGKLDALTGKVERLEENIQSLWRDNEEQKRTVDDMKEEMKNVKTEIDQKVQSMNLHIENQVQQARREQEDSQKARQKEYEGTLTERISQRVSTELDGKSEVLLDLILKNEQVSEIRHRIGSIGKRLDGVENTARAQSQEMQKLRNLINDKHTLCKRNISISVSSLNNSFLERASTQKQELLQSMVSLNSSYEVHFRLLDNELKKQNSGVTSAITSLNNTVSSDIVRAHDKMTGHVQNLKSELTGKLESFERMLQNTSANIINTMCDKMEMVRDEGRHISETMVSQMTLAQEKFTAWKNDNEKWKSQAMGKIGNLDVKASDSNTMIILIIVIIVLEIVLVLMLMLRQRNTNTSSLASNTYANPQAPANILSKVERDCINEDSLCVLSFNKNSQQLHRQLTESAVQNDRRKLVNYLLENHQSILHIPRSKVIMVYIEKNERNIILEDEAQELGDLRRTTVEAAMKMGAAVFVVYVHEESSRSLGDDLYNPRLTSIQRHRVLSKLDNEKRVLSVYDSYSQYQRQHLQQSFRDALGSHEKT